MSFNSTEQAKAYLETIKGLIDKAREMEDEIMDDVYSLPLSVEVRSGWHQPGQPLEPSEYQIILCTGGPAVRIIGDLSTVGIPESATLEHQDWYESWTSYADNRHHPELLDFAQRFFV